MAASTSRIGADGKPAAPWPAYMARYKRLEWLGAGRNGEVFKAWDTVEKRVVAVKRLSATGTDGGDSLMFSGLAEVARETRYLRACDDIPSAVKLRGKVVPAVQTGDSFIIMDYAGRLNLRGYMQRRARRRRRGFSEAEVRTIMRQLLEGVGAVHGKGIAHLDIRPENVILDDGTEDRTQMPMPQKSGGGELKEDSIAYRIGGFGMSRMKERPVVEVLTPYSAPELLLRSREYDERVDTWGLGCIMADLLSGTGEPTFGRDGDPAAEIMSKVVGIVGVKGIKRWPGFAEIMSKVVGIVGVKGIKRWPGFAGIATETKSKLPKKGVVAVLKSKLLGGSLRLRFPVWRLSSAGFKVLRGLLESNPAKRLTAAEALEMPWFQERK